MGTYETSITTFLKAYATQQTNEADITGVKYEAEDVLEYLVCQAMEVNDVYVSAINTVISWTFLSQRNLIWNFI